MGQGVFFTADTHFGHRRMLDTRPRFQTLDEMHDALVERWNAVVGKGDRVYHLGDVALGRPEDAAAILGRLNGQIYLVRGNHEATAEHRLCAGRFVWIRDYHALKVGDQTICLLHYAMRVWDKSHHGSWHLYGHSHGSLPELPDSRSFDVGVDAWDFTPVSYEQVAARMATMTWKPVDHHGVRGPG